MFRNYFKIALRNIQRQKAFSIINISGLAIGIACFIIIMLYVRFEFSYDDFHEKKDRIYRIYLHWTKLKYMSSNYYAITAAPMAPAMKEEFPEIVSSVRVHDVNDVLFTYENNSFYEKGIFADEDFLMMFSFELLKGSKESALTEPNSIIISKKLAKKYFGDEDPMNKILKYNKRINLTVKGVHADVPENSHLKFDFIISFITLDKTLGRNMTGWGSQNYHTYIEFQENFDYRELEDKLPEFMRKFEGDSNETMTFLLQPLKDVHLRSYFNFDIAEKSDIKYMYMFSIIAFVIMVIACINYMNLSTAKGTKRASEIGIRKVVGAHRRQLISQLMGETLFLTIISAIAAVLIVYLSLPYFNDFINKELELNIAENLSYVLWFTCIMIFVAIVSGSYSSLFLSSFSPIKVIKGKSGSGKISHSLRRLLVIFQFCITVFLIGGTTVVYDQMQYIKNKDLGFSREHIVVTQVRDNLVRSSYKAIRNKLIQNHNIVKVSSSEKLPYGFTSRTIAQIESKNGQFREIPHFWGYIDQDFIDLFGLRIIKGRNFSEDIRTDIDRGFIVSELLVEKMGWTDPIGKKVQVDGIDGQVIGIIRDFHHYSLHHEIGPVMLRCIEKAEYINYISIKIRPGNIRETVDQIKSTFTEINPNHTFVYFFLDDAFNDMYKSEQKLGSVFQVFTLLAIFISSLGLLGLVSFMAEQRKKEISIRKALGASVTDLVSLISIEFIKYTLTASIIALPATYYLMNNWLTNFTYRIDLGIGIFVFSTGMGVIIALLTVGYKSIRSAVSNPVDSLRYE
ncbi:ABC transporter permease [candidate division KSB1 bacterium]